MVDTVPAAVRSRIMARIKSRDTEPELLLRAALWERGMRGYRCDFSGVVGKPDIAFTRWHLAVFVDGAFWHGHPSRYWPGRTSKYWDDKIARNQARDRSVNEELRQSGWTVLRFWDFEVRQDPAEIASLVVQALEELRTAK